MLTFGEAIDATLGQALVLSALTSAALGNMVSDIFGVALTQKVEAWLQRTGLVKEPRLTRAQRSSPVVRRARIIGAQICISIGCLVGMFPLLFITE